MNHNRPLTQDFTYRPRRNVTIIALTTNTVDTETYRVGEPYQGTSAIVDRIVIEDGAYVVYNSAGGCTILIARYVENIEKVGE
jgi:hypothetical protein